MQESVTNAIFNCSDGICHHLRNARDIHLPQTSPVTATQFFNFH
jgi:hypothetical protein